MPRIGYLLPTRERVMEGRPEAAPLLALAERAEGLGFDSIWVGDSLAGAAAARPLDAAGRGGGAHHEGRARHRRLLPALRNPVVLAQQIATLDQISRGRYILGVGIASDNPHDPRRVHRRRRAVRQARRPHARRAAPLP